MMAAIENLEYQLANGKWEPCGDRTDTFLARCIKYGGVATEAEAIDKLVSGETLRNHSADWYSNCRIKPEPQPVIKAETITCDCGCTVSKVLVMRASMGSSCPDCYDKMSG